EIVYALLTGARAASDPVPPRAFVLEVPESLERLVLELLSGRIASAAQAALLLDGALDPGRE
ncbi:hypothetical protein HY251_16685, partial [bacterium]|nr:hypothetical protein [bacterium]